MGDQLLGYTGKKPSGDDLQVVSTECQKTEKVVDFTSSVKLTSIRTKFTESLLLFEISEQFWS